METTRHGAAAGEAGRPMSADWTIDQEWENYTPEEHGVWKTLFERQSKLLPGRACDEFIQGMRDLTMDAGQIPDFRRLSDDLEKRTGWRVVAVPGLVPDEVFFDHLANRRFPAGQFIRTPDQLDYLEEPDVFHDLFGHVPMLAHQIFADYMEAYGKGGLRAQGMGVLANLARVYWYTVEFGLIRGREGLRIYGSGIASSFTETIFALEDPSPNRIRFDLERVMRTLYRIDDFQETYFVLDGVEAWPSLDLDRLIPLWRELDLQPDLEPGDIRSEDDVISRGDASYHANKAKSAA
jgi:phenylalanine-4-hydroxylase